MLNESAGYDEGIQNAAADELLDHEHCPLSRGFRDQLDRAALSVSNNIAEGFERGTTAELLQFIYIARGSSGEVRSMLSVLQRTARAKRFSADVKSQISNLKAIARGCSRQLRGRADSLQNSDLAGPRHLNEKSRRDYEASKRAEACRKELLRRLPANNPLRKEAEERGII